MFLDICGKTGRVTQFLTIDASSANSERFGSLQFTQYHSLVLFTLGGGCQQTIGSQINSYQPKLPIKMSDDSLTWNLPVTYR